MNNELLSPASADRFKRRVLMVIIALGVLGTGSGWWIMSARGLMSPVLHGVLGATVVVLSALLLAAWRRLLPQRAVELTCLVYAVGVCATCMALRMYSPRYGADIDLQPLYLWFPILYVLAFTLAERTASLFISLGILLLFVCVSLPYLVHDINAPFGNFTVQLHVVSAAMIAALYFFSGYQDYLRRAQTTVNRLAHLSNTDELTGLPNRRHMAAVVDAELARWAKDGREFALMLLDIDHFKAVNDRFGHAAGDDALVALAAYATEVVDGMGVLGRWGGDEFLALVRNVGPEDAGRMADALCAYVASSPLPDVRPITISCGVTVAGRGDNIDSLLQRADAALYAAKRDGRNRAASVMDDLETRLQGQLAL